MTHPLTGALRLVPIVLGVLTGGLARAEPVKTETDLDVPPLVLPPLTLDLSAALMQPEKPAAEPGAGEHAAQPAAETPPPAPGYGRAGSQWLTVGAGYGSDFSDSNDFNLNVAWSLFLADSLEFGVEAGAWYFNQEGDDTGGVSGQLLFRWHFLHSDDYSWTLFGDFGIGILGAFDEVPDGGTGLNFLPRVGVGMTGDLDGDHSGGARWMAGVRYHHISNGRIEGDARNPARDGLMFYAAIVFPF